MTRLHAAVVVGALFILVPLAGSFGLSDVWEAHYAEVARQIRLSGDWVSLQWPGSYAEPPEFWSKPPLTFWAQAVGMAAFDVDPSNVVDGTRAEWGVRLPGILVAVLGIWAVFFATARLINRRAGVLAACVLVTAPLYALIARQAITDIYLTSTLTAALCFAAVALLDEDCEVRRGRSALAWGVVGVLATCVAPQLFALAQRVPIAHVIPYVVAFGVLVVRILRARKRSQLLLHLAFVLAGLSILAKGIVGLGIAGTTIGLFLVITRDWRGFVRARPLDLMLTVGVVALPWHHAMTALHGLPFLRELLLYNQWSRFGKGVSGERTGSLTYFVSQLGYGLLPWVAVAIGAGVAALRSKHRFVLLVVIWSVVSHGVVAASATKFHHYILPAVPPLAILCGWHLDQVLRGEAPRVARTATLLFGLPLLALVLIDLVLAQDAPERLFWLSNYDYMMMPGGLPWPADLDVRVPLAVTVTTAAIATGLVVVMRRPQVAVGALLAGALASTIYLLHVVVPAAAQSWSQKALLAHYQRVRSPEDRLFAFWLYFRGETFYSQGATFDPSMKVGDRLMAMPFWPGLGAWRNAHPRVRTYVLVPYYMIATARRNWPELEMVDDTNAHVVLMVLPPR